MYDADPFFSLLLVAFIGAVYVYEEFIKEDEEEDPVEVIKEQYVQGEISEDEFHRRLDVAVDQEADHIRAAVKPIPGIGEDTSWYIASRYDTLEDLRAADQEELEEIPGVGEKRARAIDERLE